jgi:hypothetical protein
MGDIAIAGFSALAIPCRWLASGLGLPELFSRNEPGLDGREFGHGFVGDVAY